MFGYSSVSFQSRPGTCTKFSTRSNAGEIVIKYPADEASLDWSRSNERWEPKILIHGTAETKLTTKYNYMFSRLRDKYDVIEEQINSTGALLTEKLRIEAFASNNKPNSVVFIFFLNHIEQNVTNVTVSCFLSFALAFRKLSIRLVGSVVTPPAALD